MSHIWDQYCEHDSTKIWRILIWQFACPTANLPNLILQQIFEPYSTQAVLYCATSLNRLRLHVDVIVLNLNEPVTFAHCT